MVEARCVHFFETCKVMFMWFMSLQAQAVPQCFVMLHVDMLN